MTKEEGTAEGYQECQVCECGVGLVVYVAVVVTISIIHSKTILLNEILTFLSLFLIPRTEAFVEMTRVSP